MKLKAEILDFLQQIKHSGTLVVVEGKKDKACLNKLEITNVKTLEQKPLYQVVEEIAENHTECILLTDLDKEGKKLFGTLNSNLQRHGVRVDSKFREFLFKKTKLRQIEGLATYLNSS